MTRERFKQDIIYYLTNTLLIENPIGETKLKDTGADSLDLAEMSVDIEKRHGLQHLDIDLQITDEATVNDVAEYFYNQVKA